jgi:hypothetical protein
MKRTLITATLSALAIVVTSVAASAVSTDVGHWAMDETGTPTTADDSSGLDNHGVNTDVVGDGEAYTFNGVSSRVVVADSDSLDPLGANFAFGVTLSMTQAPDLKETYDALRKGLVSTGGGNYKLEIKHAKGKAVARCVVKDAAKTLVAIQSQLKVNLADGKIHVVTCTKTGTGVTVKVDGLPARTKTVTALGSVANDADLALGAKAGTSASTGFDWYKGKLFDAWVAVG